MAKAGWLNYRITILELNVNRIGSENRLIMTTMKKANVSVSLKGASSIATDAAQIIFMDGTLGNLCAMFDISKDLNSNLTNSLGFLLLPFGVNVLGTYVVSMSLASAIVFKQVCFLTGLGNVMLPTASIKSLREQNNAKQGVI